MRPVAIVVALGLTAACARSATSPAGGGSAGAGASAPAPVATDGPGSSAATAPAAPAAKPADTGTVAAAPVKFVDLKGLKAELAERRKSGRPVLLNFWATWCAPCVDELPDLGNLARELGDKDPEIIGVSLDAM